MHDATTGPRAKPQFRHMSEANAPQKQAQTKAHTRDIGTQAQAYILIWYVLVCIYVYGISLGSITIGVMWVMLPTKRQNNDHHHIHPTKKSPDILEFTQISDFPDISKILREPQNSININVEDFEMNIFENKIDHFNVRDLRTF